ncbi:hypothetical protein Q1695_000476 [Nippostrongylus brasiliensis]|nr:hypothetical protein Q1695_000476 [Nippostrongylus brasiliensis]
MHRKRNQRPLSLTMHVPEHISVTGEPLRIGAVLEPVIMEKERAVRLMNVPDRIVLTGGNGYKAMSSYPSEAMDDHSFSTTEMCLLDLPPSRNLANGAVFEQDCAADEGVRSESSMAMEENPIRELKMMRRQIGGLSSRLYNLEYELDKRRSKEKLLLTTIFGIAAALLMALFKR